MKGTELREQFLAFFERHGHRRYTSASLVPGNDTSLLFTNAGMVPFKDVLLGNRAPETPRAVSCQRCLRAGGKHNDLENVGYTNRHHTFFEMLGNFSFGDYFKAEAILMAWEFITGSLGLPEDRLWVSVHHRDDETADIWLRQAGLDAGRIRRCDDHSNFWSMAETGPCGPCTEIYYDHGPTLAGDPPGGALEGDRYVEVWNLVFTQYNRDASGELLPLRQHAVDTGMGLERIAAIMQGVHDNYATDLFRPLIDAVRDMIHSTAVSDATLKVIADHLRASSFLIADGVMPTNEGRGYVLRRIIRRAVRHGDKSGLREPFMHRLVEVLIREMGSSYPELHGAQSRICEALLREEQRFRETLDQGMAQLQAALATISNGCLPGELVFRLYDTFGFPVDLTTDIARERGLTVDMKGFEHAMQLQRERARSANQFVGMKNTEVPPWSSRFIGYQQLTAQSRVLGLYRNGNRVQTLQVGEAGEVVLETTPFYAESGGQVGDRGELRCDTAQFKVEDTRLRGTAHVHIGVLTAGILQADMDLEAHVDTQHRADTVRNHSATHLLHAALRSQLGTHVTQQGSLVAPERLRFDFTHPEPLQPEQLAAIEQQVNAIILKNADTRVREMSLEQATAAGALCLFGEKYDGHKVRVLDIGGDFSRELCGGTHVARAGDIGLFKIISEGGVAAGIRRIEALTGRGSHSWVTTASQRLERIAGLLGTSTDQLEQQLQRLLEQRRTQEQELDQLRSRLAGNACADLENEAVDVAGIKVVLGRLDGADPKTLRAALDCLKHRLDDAVMVLASVQDEKVQLVAGVTGTGAGHIRAGELVNYVAAQVGGRGGGRKDMAQAGGNRPAALDSALHSVPEWVRERIRPG